MTKLSDLPSDIYAIILSHIPPLDRQQAVLSLSRGLPRSAVPTHQIYEHIIAHTTHAVLHLYQHFRKLKALEGDLYNPSKQVRSLNVRAWLADADLVVNLLGLLPNVPVLQLCVGTTYSPEHLQDIFTRPRGELETLKLRFKPYVERATYMPFLKGAYFDSTIVELTKWPASADRYLTNLSVMQDTISYQAHIKFAQPIAFFSFKILGGLAISPVGQHLRALRISVPAKPVAAYLCSQSSSFPQLHFLDISTTALPAPSAERAMESLLSQLIRLEHIVIDRNAGNMPRDSPGWMSLGRSCALAGVVRAKEREKEIQAWMELRRREEAVDEAGNPEEAAAAERTVRVLATPRARRGRRGLAAATISLRERAPTAASSSSTHTASSSTHDPTARRIRVVPSPPTLRTFSTAFAGPSNPSPQQRSDWSNAFTKGFLDGCATLNKIWGQMQDSSAVRVMRFTDADLEPCPEDGDTPDVFKGVADVAVAGHWIGWEPLAPVVCFGTERMVGQEKRVEDDTLPEAMWRLGMARPGAFDGGNNDDADNAGTISGNGSMTPASAALSAVVPSSVGGLWADEEFVQWGPGHVPGCGHEIGRGIFE